MMTIFIFRADELAEKPRNARASERNEARWAERKEKEEGRDAFYFKDHNAHKSTARASVASRVLG